MAPILHDGIYKLWNAKFSRSAADLINGDPSQPVSANPKYGCYVDCHWKLKNDQYGGNVVTLENCAAPGYFAAVGDNPVHDGTRVIVSRNATKWIVLKFGDGLALQTLDGVYVWELPSAVGYEPVVLVHHTGRLNTRWNFQRLGNCFD